MVRRDDNDGNDPLSRQRPRVQVPSAPPTNTSVVENLRHGSNVVVSAIVAPVENVVEPDPIDEALRWALAVGSRERDPRGVHRALLAVLAKLDDVP